jgi:beta-galactosidase
MLNIEKYWEDLNVMHVNRENSRAYYIPYGDAETSLSKKRRLLSLRRLSKIIHCHI